MNWLDELNEQAKQDPWYCKCLSEVAAKEAAFLKIRDSLPEDRRQELDSYIAACEELEHALTSLAFRMGRSQK